MYACAYVHMWVCVCVCVCAWVYRYGVCVGMGICVGYAYVYIYIFMRIALWCSYIVVLHGVWMVCCSAVCWMSHVECLALVHAQFAWLGAA